MRLDEWQDYLKSQFVGGAKSNLRGPAQTPVPKVPEIEWIDDDLPSSAASITSPEPKSERKERERAAQRRSPDRRARHARNVRPVEALAHITATELWAGIPRHMRTLVELGKRAEIETAQSSYKRPFAEDRIELIERLLDPILSLEETARLLNVCPTTVRRYTNRGILTCYRKDPERPSPPNPPLPRTGEGGYRTPSPPDALSHERERGRARAGGTVR